MLQRHNPLTLTDINCMSRMAPPAVRLPVLFTICAKLTITAFPITCGEDQYYASSDDYAHCCYFNFECEMATRCEGNSIVYSGGSSSDWYYGPPPCPCYLGRRPLLT